MQYIGRTLLKDQAVTAIRDAIVRGDLEPGTAIRDVDLAARLGLSRTPVREALSRLADEGLVEAKPGSYTRVTPLDADAVRAAHAVVQAMHVLAARSAVMGDDDIDDMSVANARFEEALKQKDIVAALDADDEFHSVAVDRCGNFAVAATIERYLPLVRRLEHQRFASAIGHHSVSMHADIIEAFRIGDGELAAQLVERNWATLKEEM
ncbi:GntR family transcriptional regulator [Lentzea sp. NBRC 105346]|uniref:GntR family transcriptional regulator n=1 Tax=Lentzea sp. NBRC 105346 TaxID=3032205 RepID=UPI0024A4CF66|nr:GntR family transcriptional regulator [Lentzea sp. NBRC 105346]GLZ34254.1 GntR family transcriptional regulator [Lentzea sp. NBRC 105346]